MDKPVVEVETMISADPSTVWKAMTRRASAMFPGTEVVSDWKVGRPIRFMGEWAGKPFKDYGEIEVLEEHRELSFSHWSRTPDRPENYHVVHYRLEPAGTRTRVTLEQIDVGPDAEVDARTGAALEKNWAKMLDGLKKSAEGH
jgi:uncharacterized protein YndB with AHSA1/START domain